MIQFPWVSGFYLEIRNSMLPEKGEQVIILGESKQTGSVNRCIKANGDDFDAADEVL